MSKKRREELEKQLESIDVSMSVLYNIFVESAMVDGDYFLCGTDDIKAVIDVLEQVPLNFFDRLFSLLLLLLLFLTRKEEKTR